QPKYKTVEGKFLLQFHFFIRNFATCMQFLYVSQTSLERVERLYTLRNKRISISTNLICQKICLERSKLAS
ncbi:MAG: hypothetical protein ACK56I_09675, partial [bacterium]